MNKHYIQVITIIDGFRSAKLDNGARHGLGAVGDPLRPFLGHRAEGYEVALPTDLTTIQVHEADTSRRKDNGLYPTQRVPWTRLAAPDVPSVSDFVDAKDWMQDALRALHSARVNVEEAHALASAERKEGGESRPRWLKVMAEADELLEIIDEAIEAAEQVALSIDQNYSRNGQA